MLLNTGPAVLGRRQTLTRLVLGLSVIGLLAACSSESDTPHPLRVGIDEGRQLFESKQVVMFDIREADEHATGVANGARLLPMSQLRQRANEIPKDPAQPVLIICNTQSRSSKVAQALKEAGWSNVRYVHGGMSAWANKGWPMVKPTGLPTS
jgi:rhodanese-related sulfurtransferase